MPDIAPAWVVPVMRSGYAARGLVYTVVGGLAVAAAWYGGATQGTTNALADLRQQSWGSALLWLIGIGLFCYAAWRIIDSGMDLERHGSDGKGAVARGGLIVTGLVHAALGVSALRLAMGSGGSGGSNAESLTARVMSWPYGPWLVGAIGLCVIGAGAYYIRKGYAGKYRADIRTTRTTQRLDPLMKAGFVAQGIVVAIIGGLILYAGITTDPSEAGGLGQALQEIRSVAFGRFLLLAIAIGLVFFAVENFVEAMYRIVPARAGDDVTTLAQKAKNEALHQANKARS